MGGNAPPRVPKSGSSLSHQRADVGKKSAGAASGAVEPTSVQADPIPVHHPVAARNTVRHPAPEPGVGSVPNPVTWAGVVTAAGHRDQSNVAAFTKVTHKPSQRGGKSNPLGATMYVVVQRSGGLDDKAKKTIFCLGTPSCRDNEEARLKASAARIVMAALTAVAKAVSTSPFTIVDGAWSRRVGKGGGKTTLTGNFSYTIVGVIPFPVIKTFATHLIGPLHVGVIIPSDK